MLRRTDFHHVVRQKVINYDITPPKNAHPKITHLTLPEFPPIFFYQKYFLILFKHFVPN